MDTAQEGSLHIYQISIKNDRLKELYQEPRSGYIWKIASRDDLLYLCQIGKAENAIPPKIQLFDVEKREMVREIGPAQLPGIARIVGRITFSGDRGIFPCMTTDGHYALAVLDLVEDRIDDLQRLSGAIYEIIGVKDDLLVYVDHPALVGERGTSLFFYDIRGRKEVKSINLPRYLDTMHQKNRQEE
jgi:hypothetical protein